MVEGINEIGTELHTDPFRYWEILVYAGIDIGVTWRSQASELR